MIQLFTDSECYRHYWLFMFQAAGGKFKAFELYEGHPLDIPGLLRFLQDPEAEFVTFNGNSYDMCMLALALSGADNEALKNASDNIIKNDLKPWDFERIYGVKRPEINHIDLIEVAPGMCSLKIYGGRIHMPRLQDMPYEHDASIGAAERPHVLRYCRNDLAVTQGLFYALKPQIDLRRTMSENLGVDVRSKSDAQIAEVVLKKKIEQDYGFTPRKLPITYRRFFYEPPAYIAFGSDPLNALLETMRTAPMVIKPSGHVEMPKAIEDHDIVINGRKYKIGIGGLHSQESEVSHYAGQGTLLRDIDVRSYYPQLMLNIGMYPPALGPNFIPVFKGIVDERLVAKDAGDKVKADTLKIVVNGSFGKTSSMYSILYNPKMMIATTLTGQLSLLMLIEALERYKIPVVSANTDGIVVKCPDGLENVLRRIVKRWEQICNLETEETNYSSIHSRDVNNYIAIKTDGVVKLKGTFATGGLAKSPQNEICSEAVVALLKSLVPVEQTIRQCRDIRKFLTLRTVNGGAVKPGYTLGKAIRWYYAVGETGTINYKTSGDIVPRSLGAKPLMDLPDSFPTDIDYDWYIRECHDLVMDIGVVPRPPKVKLPRKNSKEWKAMVESGLITV